MSLCSIISNFTTSTGDFFLFCNFNLIYSSLFIFHRHALAIKWPILVILLFLFSNFLLIKVGLNVWLDLLEHLFTLLYYGFDIINVKSQLDFLLLDFHAGPFRQNRRHENQACVYQPPLKGPWKFSRVNPNRKNVDNEKSQSVVQAFVRFFNDEGFSHNHKNDIEWVCWNCKETIILTQIKWAGAENLSRMWPIPKQKIDQQDAEAETCVITKLHTGNFHDYCDGVKSPISRE